MKNKKIKKRLFLIGGYVIGYIVQIGVYGIPDWEYLLPIRVFPLLFVGPIGYTLYNLSEKGNLGGGYINTMGYTYIAIAVLLISLMLNYLVMIPIFGIDIWPYIGTPDFS